jgi:Holliday junction resolvase
MLERDIEKHLVRRVAEHGGVAYKFVSPGRVGVADRIVVLPGGVVWFVELKSGTQAAIQIEGQEKIELINYDKLTKLGN